MRFDNEHAWANGEIDFCGFPAWLRRNESLGEINRSDYPKRLMISLAFESPDDDGLPGEQENALADGFGERLASLLETEYNALFAFVLTFDGGRDLFFYLQSDPGDDAIQQVVDRSESPCSVEFQIDEEDEDPWGLYDSFSDSIDE